MINMKVGVITPELYYRPLFWKHLRQAFNYSNINFKEYTIIDDRRDLYQKWDKAHFHRLVEVRNKLIEQAIDDGCEYLYIIDDDLIIYNDVPRALLNYVETHTKSVVGALPYSIVFNRFVVCDFNFSNYITSFDRPYFVLPNTHWLDQNWFISTSDLIKDFNKKEVIPDTEWEMREWCRILYQKGYTQVLYTETLAICDYEKVFKE